MEFCYEIKPIARLMRQSLSVENLAELLRLRYSPSPDTLFKNIRKVRPGHFVEIDLSSDRIQPIERPYLQPVPPTKHALPMEVAQSEYGGLLRRAVERQLMSDVEVGIFLSGGVDSALIAQFAQSHVPYNMKAFTVGFSETDESDEIAEAQETAAYVGLDHHAIRIGFDDFLKTFRECVLSVEEPLATTSVIPMFYLAELAARQVKVVLSGQGADEPLGGYRRYQGEIARGFIPPRLAHCLSKAASMLGLRDEAIMRALPALAEADDTERFLRVYEVFSSEEVEWLVGCREECARKRIAYFYDLLGCERQPDGVSRMMSVDMRMNLADDLLLYTDKITMRHSLECRVPMLDLEMVRFLESLPTRFRVACGRGKIIHKQLAEETLPPRIVRRRKKGFMSPTRKWFREKNAVRDLLLDTVSRFATHINLQAVRKIFEQHDAGWNRERHIFLLLGIYFWLEEFA